MKIMIMINWDRCKRLTKIIALSFMYMVNLEYMNGATNRSKKRKIGINITSTVYLFKMNSIVIRSQSSFWLGF